MDASRALALLSASPQITPLSLRLDAAALLSRIIEDHRYTIRFLDDDRALTEPLLAAVVRAMLELDAHDEELGDALVALLDALLRATSIATEQLFVQLDIMMGGSGGQSWALPSLACINVLAALHDNGGPASRDAIVAEGIMILDVIRQQDAQTPSRKRPFEPDPSASTPGGSPSKVDPPLFLTEGSGEGSGVTKEGDRPEAKRRWKELKALRLQQCKWATKTGAIIAPSRKKEGYVLPVGNQLSCLVDALYNGLCTLGFDSASLARLRKRAMPELGNDPMASWDSVIWALADLGYPYVLQESTSRFDGKGGLMLNLLRAPAGVYLVSLQVIIDGKESKHGVVLSKLAEEHAPHGKLIDNHGKMQPCYLEAKDTNGKEAAKMAWKLFIGQNPATKERPFSVNPAQVFELKKKA
ncbi:hypothetical protein Ctob_009736 [Chrysochromulina tobinii]|uniref:Uncharacterized protein n=1 Tax=Chrysochromulina tobinii TaxID=1460289 RepID=A0A0M0JNI9_9EUKA|nr:hypothetical protein Ctob_009736 [Chrysochromulina tobinii]|eukprot:KOO28149.1 hypothetical protein Ctob_009736 [Chrysochromulina sp. CCMP291]